MSDYIENLLNRTKGNETNETTSKKRNNKLRRRRIEFTNSGTSLLNDSNDKHSSNLPINERNKLLENELGPNQSACMSSTVDSLVDLDNGSVMERDKMFGKS